MASILSPSLLPTKALTCQRSSRQLLVPGFNGQRIQKQLSFRVQAARVPAGVELPKVEPKFKAPFLGFTRTAEVWNSRACMIGLIGTFFVELIINKGILQVIGVEIGKGLDLPL
ncbi:Light-harvesting complex-like protein OHP1, chloroplastic [Linum grandiflorum]